jgi:hypothetical protein
MTQVDEAFKELKRRLEISPSEQELAQTRHARIRDHIEASWSMEKTFLTGSYDRHTKTKKLKDVDIFAVIDPSGPQAYLANGTGKAAATALRDVLATKWPDVDSDEYVAVVNYAGEDVASYEVAPVFPRDGGGYLMPDGSGWMATDPNIHAELVTAKNKEMDEKFVPFVKMVKGINRHADEPIKPSFLIEVMALELVQPAFTRYQDEIRWFIASCIDHIEDDWPDPANLGNDVNADMTLQQRKDLKTILSQWLATCELAISQENDGKERQAIATWKQLFGWRMP